MHGNAKIDSDTIKITPTHAVFHIHRLPKKFAFCFVKPKLYKLVDTILQVMTAVWLSTQSIEGARRSKSQGGEKEEWGQGGQEEDGEKVPSSQRGQVLFKDQVVKKEEHTHRS